MRQIIIIIFAVTLLNARQALVQTVLMPKKEREYLIADTVKIVSENAPKRKRSYLISLFGGYKYYNSYPADQYMEDYARWKGSYSVMLSFEFILGKSANHFLGIELNSYLTGDYKAKINSLSPSVGYRYKYNITDKISASAKFGINGPSTDFLNYAFCYQSLFVEYSTDCYTFSVQYRTDLLTQSPNFIVIGFGINY